MNGLIKRTAILAIMMSLALVVWSFASNGGSPRPGYTGGEGWYVDGGTMNSLQNGSSDHPFKRIEQALPMGTSPATDDFNTLWKPGQAIYVRNFPGVYLISHVQRSVPWMDGKTILAELGLIVPPGLKILGRDPDWNIPHSPDEGPVIDADGAAVMVLGKQVTSGDTAGFSDRDRMVFRHLRVTGISPSEDSRGPMSYFLFVGEGPEARLENIRLDLGVLATVLGNRSVPILDCYF